MSLNVGILTLLTGLVLLQVWTGAEFIPRQHRQLFGHDDPTADHNRGHFIHRHEFPRLFWAAIGVQLVLVAFMLWAMSWRAMLR